MAVGYLSEDESSGFGLLLVFARRFGCGLLLVLDRQFEGSEWDVVTFGREIKVRVSFLHR